MKKTFKTQEIRRLGAEVLEVWEENKSQIKLAGKSLYNLIGTKKVLESKAEQIQDTITTLALANNGEFLESGAIKIPDDKLTEVNKKLFEFGQEEMEIEYTEIIIDEDDSIPPAILDIFFDFTKITD